MKATLLLAAASLLGPSQALQLTKASYSPCDGTKPLASVDITPCEREPCTVTPETSYKITMAGTSDREVRDVKLNMQGYLGRWRIAINNMGVCGSGLKCPVKANEGWTMRYTYNPVSGFALNGRFKTRWKFTGNGGAVEFACADILLNVVSG